MQVTVQLHPDVSRRLQGTVPVEKMTHAVLGMDEKRAGFKIEPMHPGTTDPTLSSFYAVEVPDEAAARKAIEQLSKSNLVAAAYLKPADELP